MDKATMRGTSFYVAGLQASDAPILRILKGRLRHSHGSKPGVQRCRERGDGINVRRF